MDYPIPAVTGQGRGSISTHQHQRIHPLTFSLALALQQTGLPLGPVLNNVQELPVFQRHLLLNPKAAESPSPIHGLLLLTPSQISPCCWQGAPASELLKENKTGAVRRCCAHPNLSSHLVKPLLIKSSQH